MHSKIIQLSSSPIEKDDYINEVNLYDDLDKIEPIGGDYVSDVDKDEADEIIESHLKMFSDICEVDMKKRTISMKKNPDWSRYNNLFTQFKTDISEMSFEDFLSNKEICRFKIRKALKTLTNIETCFMIDDGFYAENAFLGNLVRTGTLHIGGVVDYHW